MKAVFALAVAALAGCSTMERDTSNQFPFGKLEGRQGQTIDVGSFIQWNEDYAVTAKHVRHETDVVYVCDVGCDLKFFKHKAQEPVREWRDRVPNEEVVVVGINQHSSSQLRRGQDINVTGKLGKIDPINYPTVTAESVHGMSGGPVYGEDGKVIGMAVAVADHRVNGVMRRVTLYMPYALILNQWEKYSARSDREMMATAGEVEQAPQ